MAVWNIPCPAGWPFGSVSVIRLPRKPMPNFTMSSERLLSGVPTAARTQRIAVSTFGDREPASPTLSFRNRIAHSADRAPISTWEIRARAGKGCFDGCLEELWPRDAHGDVASATWAGLHAFARTRIYV